MSAVTHTPGPWVALPGHSCIGFIDIISRLDGVVAQVTQSDNSPSETDIANAHLIAAAPDLLAVVQELEESAGYWSEYDVPLGIVDRIRAAIAKAEGRS